MKAIVFGITAILYSFSTFANSSLSDSETVDAVESLTINLSTESFQTCFVNKGQTHQEASIKGYVSIQCGGDRLDETFLLDDVQLTTLSYGKIVESLSKNGFNGDCEYHPLKQESEDHVFWSCFFQRL